MQKTDDFLKVCLRHFKYRSVVSGVLGKRQFASLGNQNGKEDTLASGYVPSAVENKSCSFPKTPKSGKPFVLLLPPPNVTGTLHLGHALMVSIQDVLTRWHAMNGVETLWIPGLDHAGIATHVVVEKKLFKESGKTRHDIGRHEFEKEVWKWKNSKGSIIKGQLQRMGTSLDWSREYFTMDPVHAGAVVEAFVRLHEAGLVYRADTLVNWSCAIRSAVSDLEVEHVDVAGPTRLQVPGCQNGVEVGLIYDLVYKVVDSDKEIIVSTTRPETMLGDVAIAVHPSDERYSDLKHRKVWHPFRMEAIPVIYDEFVDKSFGTGAVKITPAHDQNDFAVAARHSLPLIKVINESGQMDGYGFAGMSRFAARCAIIEKLAEMGLYHGQKAHAMKVPLCSRSGDIVEQMLKPQWFVRCKSMADRASEDLRQGRLRIVPEAFHKVWYNWLDNIRDWCVSRQLWWGHRIPAYRCSQGTRTEWIVARDINEAREKAFKLFNATNPDEIEMLQTDDVLDTWFSSALLPFTATNDWPKTSDQRSNQFPLGLMVTGHDILFFWVARMVMLSNQLKGALPFHEVLLHGVLCDQFGRKMSKSLGNVVAPDQVIGGATPNELKAAVEENHQSGILSAEEMQRAIEGQKKMFPSGIPECGADALRFTLCSHNIKSHYINFDISECYANKLFGNKVWQAVRYFRMVSNGTKFDPDVDLAKHPTDLWILSRLASLVENVNVGIRDASFNLATYSLKQFLYFDFCDFYLESTKPGVRLKGSENALSHIETLGNCLEVGFRCLSPFMPHLSEHLYAHLPQIEGSQRTVWSQPFPKGDEFSHWRNEDLERDVRKVREVLSALRGLKKRVNASAKHNPQAYIVGESSFLDPFLAIIEFLSGCPTCRLNGDAVVPPPKQGQNLLSDTVGHDITVHLAVPEELVRTAEEQEAGRKGRKVQKLQKEFDRLKGIVSGDRYLAKASQDIKAANAARLMSLEKELEKLQAQ